MWNADFIPCELWKDQFIFREMWSWTPTLPPSSNKFQILIRLKLLIEYDWLIMQPLNITSFRIIAVH